MHKKILRFIPVCGFLAAAILALPHQCFGGEGYAVPESIQSQDALAYLKLDIENNPGWVATVKGGYQWKFFRHVGYSINDAAVGSHERSTNRTASGAAASVGAGYNFGPRMPLTLGLNLGVGPGGNFNTSSFFSSGGTDYSMWARQKIRSYTLDVSVDYDFKNCSRWTPFVGLTSGVTFMRNRAKGTLTDLGTGTEYSGRYSYKRRTNFVAGARAGTKYKINDCVTLSLYGSYSYLGSVRGKSLNLTDGTTFIGARTNKARVHQVDVKAGLKILF